VASPTAPHRTAPHRTAPPNAPTHQRTNDAVRTQRIAQRTTNTQRTRRMNMPRKKSVKSAPKKTTKSAFVRDLPAGLSAKEAVAKAAEAGISITAKQVYNIRGAAKSKGKAAAKRGPAAAKTGRKRGVISIAKRAGGTSTNDLLLAVAAEIGLARSIEILDGQRKAVLHVLNG
jgi:hypothetical protein